MRRLTCLTSFLLVLTASGVATAQELDPQTVLVGQWFGGDAGDDAVELDVRFDGATMVLSRISRDEDPKSYTLTFDGSNLVSAVSTSDETPARLLVRGPHDVIFWEVDDDDLFEMAPAGEVPGALMGDWVLTNPRGCDAEGTATVTATRIDSTTSRDTYSSQLWPIRTGEGVQIAWGMHDGEAPERFLLDPLPDGGWLVRQSDDDDFIIMHREHTRPTWITCRDEPIDPEVCRTAGEKLMGCLREYCLSGTSPVCDNLDQIERDMVHVPDCTIDMLPFAEEILAQECSQIVAPFRQFE